MSMNNLRLSLRSQESYVFFLHLSSITLRLKGSCQLKITFLVNCTMQAGCEDDYWLKHSNESEPSGRYFLTIFVLTCLSRGNYWSRP